MSFKFKSKIYLSPFKERIRLQTRLRRKKIKNNQYKRENLKDLPLNPRIKRLANFNGYKVYIVNGTKIREHIDDDFVNGGNGLRYLYIPVDEIWLDKTNPKEELKPILVHEYVEIQHMRKGYTYDHAHDIAALYELQLRQTKNEIILPIGPHRQEEPHLCGPAALKISLDYLGTIKTTKELAKLCKTKIIGTFHKNMIRAARYFEYSVISKEGATVSDIKYYLSCGLPVIVDYRAYHGGHLAVIVGFSQQKFILSDPAYDYKYKKIKIKEFLRRWWEYDEDPKQPVRRWLMVIRRKR